MDAIVADGDRAASGGFRSALNRAVFRILVLTVTGVGSFALSALEALHARVLFRHALPAAVLSGFGRAGAGIWNQPAGRER